MRRTHISLLILICSLGIAQLSFSADEARDCATYHKINRSMSLEEIQGILGRGKKRKPQVTINYKWETDGSTFNAFQTNGKFEQADYMTWDDNQTPDEYIEAKKKKSIEAIIDILDEPDETERQVVEHYTFPLSDEHQVDVYINSESNAIASISANMFCPIKQ